MAYQPKSYRKFVATAATATLVASAVAPAALAASSFTDVAPKYKEAVDYLFDNGITKGKTEELFGTHQEITRGELAIWLTRALGLEEAALAADPSGFADTAGTYYDGYVSVLKEEGILDGKSSAEFGVNDFLTRGQMAKLLSNAYGLVSEEEAPFEDKGQWAEFIDGLYAYGITQGKTEDTFGSSEFIKRGDIAIFLFKADTLPGEEDLVAPEFNYDGETELSIENGAEFVLPEVTATDDVDGELEVAPVITDAEGNEVALEDIDTTVAATYTVTYSAVDAAGNEAEELVLTVVVEEAEVVAPAVESVSAIDLFDNESTVTEGGTVHPTATLNVKFGEELDAETVSRANVKLYDGTVLISGSVSVSSTDKSTLVFNPSSTLDGDTEYKLVVSKAVTAGGKALASDYEFTFNTTAQASVVDVEHEGADFESGSNLGADSSDEEFTYTFNKALDAATVSTSTVKLYNVTDGQYVALQDVEYDPTAKEVVVTLPGTDLTTNKKYEVRINGVKSLDGNAAQALTTVFTRGNSTTPTVVTPSAGTNVYPFLQADPARGQLGFNLLMTVSRELDASTVSSSTVYLEEADTEAVVEAAVTYDASAGTINLVPKADLKEDQEYNIVFDGVTDKVGIEVSSPSSFTTGDFSRPTIESVNVESGSAVALDGQVKFNFSEAIDTASFAGGNTDEFTAAASVVLLNLTDDTHVDLTSAISFDDEDKTAIVDLEGLVAKGKSYKLMVSGKNNTSDLAVADDSGNSNQLASNYSLTFYVEADTTSPTVKEVAGKYVDGSKYVLTNNATNVDATQPVVFKFNDKDLTAVGATPLSSTTAVRVYNVTDKAYVSGNAAATFTIADGSPNEDTLTISEQAFEAGKTYRVELTTGIEDAAGNKVKATNYTFTFGSGAEVTWDSGEIADRTAVAVDAEVVLDVTGADLNAATVTSENVKLVKVSDGSAVSATVEYDKTADEITITPAEELDNSTQYKVVVSNVKDVNGNLVTKGAAFKPSTIEFAFETEAGLATVTNVSVANGAINVDRLKPIKVEFSAAVADMDIALTGLTEGVDYEVVPATNKKSATIYFTEELEAYTSYELTIASVAEEIDETINFTTGSEITDVVAPSFEELTIGTVAVDDLSTPVSITDVADLDENLVFNFDEENVKVKSVTFTRLNDNEVIAILSKSSVDVDGTKDGVAINPIGDLEDGKTYKVELVVEDADGNATSTISVLVDVDTP